MNNFNARRQANLSSSYCRYLFILLMLLCHPVFAKLTPIDTSECNSEFKGKKIPKKTLTTLLKAHKELLDDLKNEKIDKENFSKDSRYLNLCLVDLTDASLNGANLQEANLEGANLEGVNLNSVNLQEAHLYGANFKGRLFPIGLQ